MKSKPARRRGSQAPAAGPPKSDAVEPRTDAGLAGLVVGVKFLVLLYGAHAFTVLNNQRPGGLYGCLSIWNRWDAPHYLDIARGGYVSQGVEARWIVFYPFYPWLVRAASLVLRDGLLGAFFVSAVASVAAALVLYRLARLDETDETARASVFFLLTFPTAYFLHIGYTESLFIALAVGAFLSARRGLWKWAGLLGGLAGMTRVNGLVLVPALACEAFAAYRAGGRRWRWEWLWSLAAGAGFACYLLINYLVHGDPLAFMKAQGDFWYRHLTWPWRGVAETFRSVGAREPSESVMVGWQELLFVLLGLGATVWSWARLRTSYAVWMTLNWLLWTCTTFVLSVPRYTLVMFPMFFLFARASARRPLAGALILVWSLLFMGLFAARFVTGNWAF